MVEFWTDHFNISVQKGDCWFLKIVDDREVIREHALGNFRELLGASAHSPAMLVYLDNQENHKDAPNENYARELMELHTLGLSGGYTQSDVMELARCLTGWRVKEHFWKGKLKFEPDFHAPGPKTVLGHTIQPGGETELEQVLDILANHPSTARTIATKLARRFLADDPPPGIVDKASLVFQETSGDIKAVLRVIILEGLPAIHRGKIPSQIQTSLEFPGLSPQTDRGGNQCRPRPAALSAPHGTASLRLAHTGRLPGYCLRLAGKPAAALAVCSRSGPEQDTRHKIRPGKIPGRDPERRPRFFPGSFSQSPAGHQPGTLPGSGASKNPGEVQHRITPSNH